jgi:hypothetical protein
MDIHAKDAQLDKFHHQVTCTTAMNHYAMVNTPLEPQSMLTAVENAKTANGQDIFQIMKEQDVS